MAALELGPTVILKLSGSLAVQADVERSAFQRNLAVGTTFRVGVAVSH